MRDFGSYREFRSDLWRHGPGCTTDAIEELAEDLYHKQIDAEFASMWDTPDEDD